MTSERIGKPEISVPIVGETSAVVDQMLERIGPHRAMVVHPDGQLLGVIDNPTPIRGVPPVVATALVRS